MHEQVLSAEHCQQLVAKLTDLVGDALGAQTDLQMSVPVPSSLCDAIMSDLRSGGASPVAAGALTVEDMGSGMVMMPAKISGKAVPLHKDRYGGKCGALVEGYSAVLYLSDGGAMSFVDASSKRRVRDVSVVPGRLVVWDNVSLLHEVGPAEASAPRFMLGPMSVNPMDQGALVAVGGGGGGDGGWWRRRWPRRAVERTLALYEGVRCCLVCHLCGRSCRLLYLDGGFWGNRWRLWRWQQR